MLYLRTYTIYISTYVFNTRSAVASVVVVVVVEIALLKYYFMIPRSAASNTRAERAFIYASIRVHLNAVN